MAVPRPSTKDMSPEPMTIQIEPQIAGFIPAISALREGGLVMSPQLSQSIPGARIDHNNIPSNTIAIAVEPKKIARQIFPTVCRVCTRGLNSPLAMPTDGVGTEDSIIR